MEGIYIGLKLLASLLRFLGTLAFGVTGGWFALRAFNKEARWELQLGVFLGLFAFVALAGSFSSAGSWGGLLIGLAIALLVWGILPERKAKAGEEAEEED